MSIGLVWANYIFKIARQPIAVVPEVNAHYARNFVISAG